MCITYPTYIVASESINDTPVAAQQSAHKRFENVWSRSSIPSNRNSAAYLTINNNTKTAFTIVAATAPDVANNVEIHNSFVDEKGISRMVAMDKVIVPKNTTIKFQPGGIHIMLFNLKTLLRAGDSFKLNLILENEGPVELDCQVK